MGMCMRIAIVEDDNEQAVFLEMWIKSLGHDCFIFGDGAQFVQSYAKESFDLVVLDWVLPSMSGIEVLSHVRGSGDHKTPVLFVTAKNSETDIVQGLEAGADDYMSKPLHEPETKARINALLRRSGAFSEAESAKIDFSPYEIDTSSRTLSLNGEAIGLTQKEFELILFLLRNEGRVISRGHLLQVVWGTSPNINTRTVDTHISRLRSKLELKPEITGWELSSIYQHGYRLEKTNKE